MAAREPAPVTKKPNHLCPPSGEGGARAGAKQVGSPAGPPFASLSFIWELTVRGAFE